MRTSRPVHSGTAGKRLIIVAAAKWSSAALLKLTNYLTANLWAFSNSLYMAVLLLHCVYIHYFHHFRCYHYNLYLRFWRIASTAVLRPTTNSAEMSKDGSIFSLKVPSREFKAGIRSSCPRSLKLQKLEFHFFNTFPISKPHMLKAPIHDPILRT